MRSTLPSLAAVTGSALLLAVEAQPLSQFSANIPLNKRSIRILANADGQINWDSTQNHIAKLFTKYQQGLVNYQLIHGEPLLGAPKFSDDEIAAHLAERSAAFEEDLPTIEEAFTLGSDELTGDPKGILRPRPNFGIGKRDADATKVVELAAKKPKKKTPAQGTARQLQAAGATPSSAGTGSEPLTSYQNGLLWYGDISIGTPAQHFKIDFDTGSGDLWIPAADCATCAASHSRYQAASSSTSSIVAAATFSISYGDGSTTAGAVYSDTVTVAGLSVTGQSFGVAQTLASSFAADPMDGIMGMAYQSISSIGTAPFFATLMAQNKVSSNSFSFKLSDTGASSLYLGGADSSAYTGSFEYSPVVSQSYWVITGNPQVNGQAALSAPINAIIDTGTTVIVAPPAQAKQFWSKVTGAKSYGNGYYTYPCAMTTVISFNFGGSNWAVSPTTLSLGAVGSNGMCLGAIIGQDVGLNAWIVGDSFLKNVYTTFDQGNNRVGFASLA